MTRPVGVILTAVVQVLGSLLALMFSVWMLFMPALMRNTPTATPPNPMGSQVFYLASAMYGVLAVLGFLTAIGLIRLKNWARYSTLIFAGFLVLMGLMVALVIALLPMPTPPAEARPVPPGTMTAVRAFMTAFPLGFAALGATWLYYFNRARTKLHFTQADASSAGDAKGILIAGRRLPLSIFVIAVLNLLGAAFLVPFAFWIPATMLLGVILTGFAAKAATLLMGAIGIYIGLGMLRLSNPARLVAIGWNCLHVVSSIVAVVMPVRFAQYVQIVQNAWNYGVVPPANLPMPASFMRMSMLFGSVIPLVVLYFLMTRASAFRTETAQVTPLAQ